MLVVTCARQGKIWGVSGPDPVKCTVVLMCHTKEAGILWMEQRPVSLHPGHLSPPQSGHWGFSLLAASKKDEPG
jgi:hypothetical protein